MDVNVVVCRNIFETVIHIVIQSLVLIIGYCHIEKFNYEMWLFQTDKGQFLLFFTLP
jgi:hypothetical protein